MENSFLPNRVSNFSKTFKRDYGICLEVYIETKQDIGLFYLFYLQLLRTFRPSNTANG